MISKAFRIRPQSSLPLYCSPVVLFLSVWLVMLGSLKFEITDVSYPDFSLPLLIFAGSFLSFLLGYYVVRVIWWKQINRQATVSYLVDIGRLRRFSLILGCIALLLLIYNYASFGLPPFFGLFGIPTLSVNSYGRWKQLLGPLLMALFVDAFLETSSKRKILYAGFGFASMLLYVARGSIMLMCFQAFIVYSIRTTMSAKKLYLAAFSGVALAGLFFGILGNYRTADAILFGGLQIKADYQQWPTIYVWIIAYISVPFSNLCWFVKMAHFDHPTWSFAYPLLPSFWVPIGPHDDIQNTSKIVDGVHTYLANYFLDFSYFGIFIINLLIGVASGMCSLTNRMSRKFLVSSILLSCIAFMFFWDFFVSLSTLLLVGIQWAGQTYFMRELPPTSVSSMEVRARKASSMESA